MEYEIFLFLSCNIAQIHQFVGFVDLDGICFTTAIDCGIIDKQVCRDYELVQNGFGSLYLFRISVFL